MSRLCAKIVTTKGTSPFTRTTLLLRLQTLFLRRRGGTCRPKATLDRIKNTRGWNKRLSDKNTATTTTTNKIITMKERGALTFLHLLYLFIVSTQPTNCPFCVLLSTFFKSMFHHFSDLEPVPFFFLTRDDVRFNSTRKRAP